LINIAKNKILQNIHSGFEKQVLLLDYMNIKSENHKKQRLCYFFII